MPVTLVVDRHTLRAEDSAAFAAIAERFRRAGDAARAVTLCRDGLARFPEHMSARVTLGWALLDLRRFSEARQELEAVLKRAPDNLAAIRGLARLHDHHDEGEAPADVMAAVAEPVTEDDAPVEFVLEDVWPPEDLLEVADGADPKAPATHASTIIAELEAFWAQVEARREEVLSECLPALPA